MRRFHWHLYRSLSEHSERYVLDTSVMVEESARHAAELERCAMEAARHWLLGCLRWRMTEPPEAG